LKFLEILSSIPVTDLKKAFIYVVLDAKWTNVYMLPVDWFGIEHYLHHRPEHIRNDIKILLKIIILKYVN